MNRPRKKGTVGENFLLARLRLIWPTTERAPLKGTQDRGDFVNVPLLVEMKNTAKPLFLQWVRGCRAKTAGGPWCLVWKGDLRTVDGQALMVVDLDHGLRLLESHYCKERVA